MYKPVDSNSAEYVIAQMEITPAKTMKVDTPTPIIKSFISIGLEVNNYSWR